MNWIEDQMNLVESKRREGERLFISHFEDLPNEVFYEILDYLDGCHAYEAFSNLNTRFEYLLNSSSLPLKLHFSFSSKSDFQHRFLSIVKPNVHRIIALSLSNPCNADRWERLILHYMPYLKIFRFQHWDFVRYDDDNKLKTYHARIERFMGLFWLERQWIFAHRHIKIEGQEDCSMFYSIEPYRKKNYKLYEFEPSSICTCSDSELISVRHLEIE
ncbi:unnamed protein product, partial [Rotaria sordida]